MQKGRKIFAISHNVLWLGTISISTTSNDLRTETFECALDLHYSWALDSSTISPIDPKKKLILPLHIKRFQSPYLGTCESGQGQSCTPVLTSQSQGYGNGNPDCVDLRESNIGSTPFLVISIQVFFSSKITGRKKVDKEKHEMIKRTYLLPSTIQSHS